MNEVKSIFSEEDVLFVKRNIEMFPTVEFDYCRNKSQDILLLINITNLAYFSFFYI